MSKNKVNNNILLKPGGGLTNDPTEGLGTSFQLAKTLTAGVELTKGDACIVGVNGETLYAISGNDTFDLGGWFSSPFVASIHATSIISATLKFYNPNDSNSVTLSAQIHIYSNNSGIPGTSLGSVFVSKSLNGYSGGTYLITGTFSPPITITPGETYFLVFRDMSVNSSGRKIYGVSDSLGFISSNSGSSWSTFGRLDSTIRASGLVAGKIYKANASVPNIYSENYFGIAGEDIISNEEGVFHTNEIVNIFTGLIPGSIYYLSNTDGQISTTPGTIPIKIGIAISDTELLLQ